MKEVAKIIVIFLFVLNFAKAEIKFCDHSVVSGDNLNNLIVEYLKELEKSNQKFDSKIYQKNGLISKVLKQNKMHSINQLKVGQVIQLPCKPEPKIIIVEKKLEKPKPKKYEYFIHTRTFIKSIKSDDITNNSKGDIYVYPNFGIGGSVYHRFEEYIHFKYHLNIDYISIDEPDSEKSIDKKNTILGEVGINTYFGESELRYFVDMNMHNTLFFKSKSLNEIEVEEYQIFEISLGLEKKFKKFNSIVSIAISGYTSNEIDSGGALKLGLENTVSSEKQLSLISNIKYENIETEAEKQKNFIISFKLEKKI